MRLNPDPQIKDVKFINPKKLSIEELEAVRKLIYRLTSDDLNRDERGRAVLQYLVKISNELAIKTGIGYYSRTK